LRRKQTDHDHLAGSFPNRPAEKTGMTFVENINDPVIVDVLASFADFVAACRTQLDVFGNRLVTFGAESHNFSIASIDPYSMRTNQLSGENEIACEKFTFILEQESSSGMDNLLS
jgi:hypothetical protein